MTLPEVDRLSVTTVVDNFIDSLRADEKIAKRFTHAQARRMPTLKAEHGLGHWVEVERGGETRRIAFDFGLTGESYTHNFLELGLDAGQVDAVALSHGHMDHYGGLGGFLKTYRRRMKQNVAFYGGSDHFLPRYNERNNARVYIGRLDRDELERYDLERIEVPTLAISAADDRYGTIDAARYTAEHIQGARFVGYETGGHLCVGHNDDLLAEIASFLMR